MTLYEFLYAQYGPNEPIFTSDITFENYSQPWIYKQLNQLCEEGKLARYEKGICYIPTQTPFGISLLNPRKVIERRYVSQNGETVGFYCGLALQNRLRLTTQMPNVIEICTNNEASRGRTVTVGSQRVLLRKARTKVTAENADVLSFLELMNDLDMSTLSEDRKKLLADFVSERGITRKDISAYAPFFPDKALRALVESEVIYSVAP